MTTAQRRGFSLIEAIIALVILSVAVPGMFWAIRDASERRVEPVMQGRARWLAAEKIEDILADRASPGRGYAYIAAPSYPPDESMPGFPGFRRQVDVDERGPDLVSPGAGYKVVTVSVGYTGARGEPRTFQLAAVVTDY